MMRKKKKTAFRTLLSANDMDVLGNIVLYLAKKGKT